EAGTPRIRSGLAEPRYARKHDALVDGAQAFVIDAETDLHVRPIVFNDHVRLGDERVEQLAPFRLFEIERDAALVAVRVLEIGAVAFTAHALRAVNGLGRLDLDDVGAPVRELTDRQRSGANAREVEDGEARQGHGHGVFLLTSDAISRS